MTCAINYSPLSVQISEYCGKALGGMGSVGIVTLVENINISKDFYASTPICHLAAAAMQSEFTFYGAMRSSDRQDDTGLPLAVATMEASAERGVPAIAFMLKSSDRKAREFAANALALICTRSAGLRRKLPPLDVNARDEEIDIRQRGEKASAALQLAVDQTRAALQDAINDENPKVRQHAADAVKAIEGSNGKP
jgi:hypothetical protein